MQQLIPTRFLFRVSHPCLYVPGIPDDDDELFHLPDACRLDSFAALDGRREFADIRMAWNEQGLAVEVQVRGKECPPEGDEAIASASVVEATSGARGRCVVTHAGTAGLVLRGRLLLPRGAEDGELLVDGAGIIRCVGPTCGDGGATRVTCTDAVISPGLVNTHDHIAFATTPPRSHGAERFEHLCRRIGQEQRADGTARHDERRFQLQQREQRYAVRDL